MTRQDLAVHITWLYQNFYATNPCVDPSTSSSEETSTSAEGEQSCKKEATITEKADEAQALHKRYTEIKKRYVQWHRTKTPIEQGQHTTLPRSSDGIHTAAMNKKPSTKDDGEELQDELPASSKRPDGPSATTSKNINSSNKTKGKKKKN